MTLQLRTHQESFVKGGDKRCIEFNYSLPKPVLKNFFSRALRVGISSSSSQRKCKTFEFNIFGIEVFGIRVKNPKPETQSYCTIDDFLRWNPHIAEAIKERRLQEQR